MQQSIFFSVPRMKKLLSCHYPIRFTSLTLPVYILWSFCCSTYYIWCIQILPLCLHSNFYLTTRGKQTNVILFVAPQMSKVVALTKGGHCFCHFIAADVCQLYGQFYGTLYHSFPCLHRCALEIPWKQGIHCPLFHRTTGSVCFPSEANHLCQDTSWHS